MLFWVALNMVEGLKPVQKASLIRAFNDAASVFRQAELELAAVPEVKPDAAYRIAHFNKALAEREIETARAKGLKIVCLDDPQYPSLLKSIPDPPLVLYVHGDISVEEVCVALVGSRKPTPYGLNVTQHLAGELGAAGVTIVSGLARGVDARAHVAALQTGSRTIAVLGSGIDNIYPSEHRNLADKIAAQGAVISEFPLGTAPNRENFPVRNRIISGLSHAVVIVEASQKSGSLITARMASEQGREVLAVPGSIFNESSRGTNALIKDGAALVQSWKDIIAQLPAELAQRINIRISESEGEIEKELNELEKSIISILSFDQPRHVDQLSTLVHVPSQELLGALVNLELKNYISQMPGKNFIRVK